MDDYLQQANGSLLTMIQIETQQALNEVEDIAAVDGVDVLFVGPFDLGNNIGHPIVNGVIHPGLAAAIDRVLEVSHTAGKKCGIYCTSGVIARKYAKGGFYMVHVATDISAIRQAVAQELNTAMGGDAVRKGGHTHGYAIPIPSLSRKR